MSSVNVVGQSVVTLPVYIIEWAPKNWSKRDAWGKDTPDGFYLTKIGDLYRLNGPVVVFVTEEIMQ